MGAANALLPTKLVYDRSTAVRSRCFFLATLLSCLLLELAAPLPPRSHLELALQQLETAPCRAHCDAFGLSLVTVFVDMIKEQSSAFRGARVARNEAR
jgi:hypothetical protein